MDIFTHVPTNYDGNVKYFPSSLSQKLGTEVKEKIFEKGKREREKRERQN